MNQRGHADHDRSAAGFTALVETWLETLSSGNTRAGYRRDLDVYSVWMHASGRIPMKATTADIEAFRARCESDGAGVATVNRRLAALSSFYRHIGQAGSAPDPLAGAQRPASTTKSGTAQLSDRAAGAVWRAAADLGSKTAAVVGLVLLDGLKTNELLLIDIEHLFITRSAVTVNVARRQRGDRIVLDPRTAAVVRRHVADRGSGPLLLGDAPTRQSARLTRFGVDYLVKKVGSVAGLPSPLTINMLRRTHIVTVHASGVHVDDLRKAVGHASSRTTLRYLPDRTPSEPAPTIIGS